jgi:peptidoglycan/LPS O-acetylase OafA/YrhL
LTGTFRFVLALVVVFSHLAGSPHVAHMGFYAVRAFFVLSGFVMTSALNEVYGSDGFRFWSNRFLRLLPPYYAVCLATALAIRLCPEHAAAFQHRWGYAMTAHAVADNLLLVPLAFPELKFRFVPPAWSVAVELMMYFVLYAGMARSLRGALLCLTFGVAVQCAWLVLGASFDERYYASAGAVMSFALGATLYFARKDDARAADFRLGALATVGWVVNLLAEGPLFPDGYAFYGGFYVNTVLAALVVVFLTGLDPGPRLKKLDEALGHLSYPVFLCQWLGGFVAYLVWSGAPSRGWGLTLGALPVILALAAALAWASQVFIEPLRARIRMARPQRLAPNCASQAPAE